jgi:membrane peptidoglycan carboxypeptidase
VLATLAASVVWYRPIGERALTGAAYLYVTTHHTPPLTVLPTPGVTRVLTASGTPLATFTAQGQIPVDLHQVSRVFIAALLTSEDRTFYTNDGVDPRGIARAALDDLLGHPTQGGSTITQQYVKNVLIGEYGAAYADSSTITRKIREVAYAAALTRMYSKNDILSGYINSVYFGSGAYGVGAAARRYFSLPASRLNAAQSALLVGLVRSPSAYDPLVHPAAAIVVRNTVLFEMAANKVISHRRATAAASSDLQLHPGTLTAGCLSSSTPFFCDWVSTQIVNLPQLGATRAQRLLRLATGGLTITTTLRNKDQAAAQAAVISKVGYTSPIGSSIVTVQPGTGAVLAMASNRIYGLATHRNQTTLNYATAVAPVGSTMKIFTLATAFASGVPLTTTLPAGATYHSTLFDNPSPGYYMNADPSTATNVSIATATADSINTAFVQLEEKVGVLPIAATARAFGLSIASTGQSAPTKREGSFTLGARPFSPVEMAAAYATLAANGTYCVPHGVQSITYADGVSVNVPPVCHQVVTPAIAETVTALLAGVVQYGTGLAAAVPGHPLVGKTGTTSNFGAAWFDGYTPLAATAVWVGNPLGPNHPLYNIDGVSQVYGGTLPAQEFSSEMTSVLASTPPWSIPALSSSYLVAPTLVVPDVTGLPVSIARARLRRVGLRYQGPVSGVVVTQVPASATPTPPGTVVRVSVGTW